MEFLNELNEAQRAATESLDGPHLVIAGAGSGKTRVLTYRLAYILAKKHANPFELMALTFTNKAAKEMKERIYQLVGPEARDIKMGTFHSIFSRMLRKEAEKIGYTSSYTIYDNADSINLVKLIVKELRLDDKKFKPRPVYNLISAAKNKLINAELFRTYVQDEYYEVASRIYDVYQERCFKANAMDFSDLLMKPVELFQAHPDLLYKYQHQYRFLMVDEYQDTNYVQYLLTKMLAASHENICVVGDDAQSIYAFRGANIENILNFKKDYPDLKIFKLEQNYRSTSTIVNAANSIIKKNEKQIPKVVFTENETGEPIQVIEAASELDEARRVCDMIREQKQMLNFYNKDFAVLYRTNAQSRALEDAMRKAGLPYRVFGGLSFYQRKEIKDIIAYLRLAVNPTDEQAIRRVINYPARGIGKTTIGRLFEFAEEKKLNTWDAILQVAQSGLNRRATETILSFAKMIKSFGALALRQNAWEVAGHISKQTGILKELHADNSIEGLSRWENVQELLNAAQVFTEDDEEEDHSLENFLAGIALFTDQDKGKENPDHVTLMTIHSAKGLEFGSLFVVGMEENLFPNTMAMESRNELEEERRLFYVAVTRAEKRLALIYAKSRRRFGNIQYNEPSRFINEIDGKYLHWPRMEFKRTRPLRSQEKSLPEVKAPTLRNLKPVSQALHSQSNHVQNDDLTSLATGMEVMHQKFGKGKVVALEGNGDGRKATVFFHDKGRKVLLLKYAKLQILEG